MVLAPKVAAAIQKETLTELQVGREEGRGGGREGGMESMYFGTFSCVMEGGRA